MVEITCTVYWGGGYGGYGWYSGYGNNGWGGGFYGVIENERWMKDEWNNDDMMTTFFVFIFKCIIKH